METWLKNKKGTYEFLSHNPTFFSIVRYNLKWKLKFKMKTNFFIQIEKSWKYQDI